MPERNQLLINYYKKEEMKKVKEMMREKLEVGEILENINMEWISKEEVLDIIGEDYEPVIKESKVADKDKNENMKTRSISLDHIFSKLATNFAQIIGDYYETSSVTQNTQMEIARKYKKYFEEYNQNRKEICKDKNISNGTFQKYLRLNYLIPELQELVNNKELGINPAEHISFLDEENQMRIAEIIRNYNYKITNNIAQKTKRDFRKSNKLGKNYILSKEKIENYKNEKSLKIIFTQEEIDKYFLRLPNREVKEYIISILENIQNVWGIAYGKYRETKDRY